MMCSRSFTSGTGTTGSSVASIVTSAIAGPLRTAYEPKRTPYGRADQERSDARDGGTEGDAGDDHLEAVAERLVLVHPVQLAVGLEHRRAEQVADQRPEGHQRR